MTDDSTTISPTTKPDIEHEAGDGMAAARRVSKGSTEPAHSAPGHRGRAGRQAQATGRVWREKFVSLAEKHGLAL